MSRDAARPSSPSLNVSIAFFLHQGEPGGNPQMETLGSLGEPDVEGEKGGKCLFRVGLMTGLS
jgi:hypothetical protein